MTPEGSTHVISTSTGTTSSFSRTATQKLAAPPTTRQRLLAEAAGGARLRASAARDLDRHPLAAHLGEGGRYADVEDAMAALGAGRPQD